MPFQPSLMFVGEIRSLPEQLNVASLEQAPASPTNIIQGWRGMPVTNTLAYIKHSQITDVKSYTTLSTNVNKTCHQSRASPKAKLTALACKVTGVKVYPR